MKKPNEMAMIHDTDSCMRPRLNRQMVLNRSWESRMFIARNPYIYKFFPHLVVGLNGDIATTTTLQEVGSTLPTNVSALDKHLPTIEIAGTNLTIVIIQ